MKKSGWKVSFLVLAVIIPILIFVHFSTAVIPSTAVLQEDKVAKAYSCLGSKIGNSSSLSLEEAAFSMIALGDKYQNKINATINNQRQNIPASGTTGAESCWPKTGCTNKDTAQATLALNRIQKDTVPMEIWLDSRKITPTNLNWFLEIDIQNHETADCTISYDNIQKTISIDSNMQLKNLASDSCLSITTAGYWMGIQTSCLNKEFKVSCTKDFVSTLLYEKANGGTIYVSSTAHTASANDQTSETINAKCLKSGTNAQNTQTCDYEGTLWGAVALFFTGNDVNAYIPYLLASAEDNQQYLPSAFLYFLTGSSDQFNEIVKAQSTSGYWQKGSDRYYDTALGLVGLGSDPSQVNPDSNQVTKAKNYLITNQITTPVTDIGCWNSGANEIRDTAFILYAGWPRDLFAPGPPAVCGDGVVDSGEQCDLGSNNRDNGTCSTNCKTTTCGDGTVQRPNGAGKIEACDPADSITGPYCNSTCDSNINCGNHIVDSGEQCDPTAPNDPISPANCNATTCRLIHGCGNSVIETSLGEQCDHGALNGLDGECTSACKFVNQPPSFINVIPPQQDFGDIPVNNKSDESVFSIYNSNSVARILRITSVSTSDSSVFILNNSRDTKPKFCQLGTNGVVINVGDYCEVGINFRPTANRSFTGQLIINSDDPVIPQERIDLRGQGIIPAPLPPTPTPKIDILPRSLYNDFGIVSVGQISDAQTLTIKSIGTADLTINSVDSEGSGDFHVNDSFGTSHCPSTPFVLRVNDSCTVAAYFNPLTNDLSGANITINSNDPDKSQVKFNIYGIGSGGSVTPPPANQNATCAEVSGTCKSSCDTGEDILSQTCSDSSLFCCRNATLTSSNNCESNNYYCESAQGCLDSGATLLYQYDCSQYTGFIFCCSQKVSQETCEQKSGKICAQNEQCSGNVVSAADGTCCMDVCQPVAQQNACETVAGGTCKVSCGTGEDTLSQTCSDPGLACCKTSTNPNPTPSPTNWALIIILGILIIIVILAIIYRDKIRVQWYKMKGKASSGPVQPSRPSGFGPSPGPMQGPRPPFSGMGGMRPMQRPMQQPPMPRPMQQARSPAPTGIRKPAAKSEHEDTLRKLKEISEGK